MAMETRNIYKITGSVFKKDNDAWCESLTQKVIAKNVEDAIVIIKKHQRHDRVVSIQIIEYKGSVLIDKVVSKSDEPVPTLGAKTRLGGN